MNSFIAHVKKDPIGNWELHQLEDHLSKVGTIASKLAGKFGAQELAKIIGLWHDLGKFKAEFQERIKIKSGYDEEAHLEGHKANSVKHAITGAMHSMEVFGDKGKLFAFPIAGHHTGLRNLNDLEFSLQDDTEINSYNKLLTYIPKEISEVNDSILSQKLPFKDGTLLIRMLFSCLVDADRLDTESFMAPDISKNRENQKIDSMETMENKLSQYLETLQSQSKPSKVNSIRKKVLQSVNDKATLEPGFFSLTVPTGGGKTLSSLSFAIKHSLQHNKKSIIYAIPYTSIIEQNAKVFKSILGDKNVFEHHSSIEVEDDKANIFNRLLSENWDHPLIVTTNVQFFESLFSAKTSKTRKIHNIANSVIILDEAQMLPPDFLQPILNCLKELVDNYNATVIFCTATQPAFGSHKTLSSNFSGIDSIQELAPDPEQLHQDLKRVKIHYSYTEIWDWETLSKKVQSEHSALVIVNRKDDAIEIYKNLEGNKYHLSTNMCPQHRLDTFAKIKENLGNKESIYVVSTQLIEAGVDLDFPVVFRAMSGLDSIAQAAGRCNREGKLEGLGNVYVFETERKSPRGHLFQAETVGRNCLKSLTDPLHPNSFTSYFEELFWVKGDERLDSKDIEYLKKTYQFESISNAFRLISEDTVSILVPYGKGIDLILELKKLSQLNPSFLKKMQRFMINVRREHYNELIKTQVVSQKFGCISYLEVESYYDSNVGFRPDSVETVF